MSGSTRCTCSAIPRRHRASDHTVVVYDSRKPVSKEQLREAAKRAHASAPSAGVTDARVSEGGGHAAPSEPSAAPAASPNLENGSGRQRADSAAQHTDVLDVVREMHSDAAGVDAAGADREPAVLEASSPLHPEGSTSGDRVVSTPARPSARDPRLGSFMSLQAFQNALWRKHRINTTTARQVAGIGYDEPLEALLDYAGGLDALFSACADHANGIRNEAVSA